MIFAPLVPLALFALWGAWKQRANPRLPLALAGGGLAAGVAVSIGLGASFVLAIIVVALFAVVWAVSLAFR
jgi:hypothetical protein